MIGGQTPSSPEWRRSPKVGAEYYNLKLAHANRKCAEILLYLKQSVVQGHQVKHVLKQSIVKLFLTKPTLFLWFSTKWIVDEKFRHYTKK